MISMFLNLLKLVLWPKIIVSSETILCLLEAIVYFIVPKCSVLYKSFKSTWSNVSFKSNFLKMFCMDDLSIKIWGIKVPYYIAIYFDL